MSFADVLIFGIVPILGFSVMMAFVRLLRGPSLSDRVVALDLMSTLGIGIITIFAMATDQSEYLDVAAVMALTSFLGTIAFAYYIQERRVTRS
jgi:multicomponent Na+:H+ antiporter subunit F